MSLQLVQQLPLYISIGHAKHYGSIVEREAGQVFTGGTGENLARKKGLF